MKNRLQPGADRLAGGDNLRSEKFVHRAYNVILLLLGKLREHGQRNDLAGHAFRHRIVPFAMTEVRVGFLQMERNRVMDASANSSFRQTSLQCLAVLYP